MSTKTLSKKAKARKAQILKRRTAKRHDAKPHARKHARPEGAAAKRAAKHLRARITKRRETETIHPGGEMRTGYPPSAEWPQRAAFASITLHIPGKNAGRALCGADEAGIPAADPAMFGPLIERLETARAVASELAATLDIVGLGLGTCAIRVCPGCDANLRRMISGDAKKLETFRGRPNGVSAEAAE